MGLSLLLHPVLLSELVYATGGIHDFLLAGIKRMTSTADIQMQIARRSRAGFEGIAAAARNGNFRVGWMDFGFHGWEPLSAW